MITPLYISFIISFLIIHNKEFFSVTGFIPPSQVLFQRNSVTSLQENINQLTILSWVGQSDENEIPRNEDDTETSNSENIIENGQTLKANRFSKFAPDADLPADEFRRQLKENMKADLERRRRNDSTRGNQPAKNYLDNL